MEWVESKLCLTILVKIHDIILKKDNYSFVSMITKLDIKFSLILL